MSTIIGKIFKMSIKKITIDNELGVLGKWFSLALTSLYMVFVLDVLRWM